MVKAHFNNKKKKTVIYDSVDEELQLQTRVRSDGGRGEEVGLFLIPQALPLDPPLLVEDFSCKIMSKNRPC